MSICICICIPRPGERRARAHMHVHVCLGGIPQRQQLTSMATGLPENQIELSIKQKLAHKHTKHIEKARQLQLVGFHPTTRVPSGVWPLLLEKWFLTIKTQHSNRVVLKQITHVFFTKKCTSNKKGPCQECPGSEHIGWIYTNLSPTIPNHLSRFQYVFVYCANHGDDTYIIFILFII